jgi:hypothetical protein
VGLFSLVNPHLERWEKVANVAARFTCVIFGTPVARMISGLGMFHSVSFWNPSHAADFAKPAVAIDIDLPQRISSLGPFLLAHRRERGD